MNRSNQENESFFAYREQTFGETLLEWIELSIEKKEKNPVFLISNKIEKERKKIIIWIDKILFNHRWVKYKHLKRNIFELKEYFPCPPDDVCQSIIDETIEGINSVCSDKSKKVCFKTRSVIYNEKEIRKEMLFALRTNFSEISYYHPELDPNPSRNRYICEINFQQDELGRIIPSGYMPLEQK